MSRLLILDDEPNVINALQRVLKRHLPKSVQVEIFDDPVDALQRAKDVAFDVILSDYRMPQMDGITFLQLVMQTQPHAVRMILSASTEVDAIMKAINDVEAFRYLTKPWHEAELVEQIQLALKRGAQLREERHLADDMRTQMGTLTPQARELRRLEESEPGITHVDWGPQGEVLMPALPNASEVSPQAQATVSYRPASPQTPAAGINLEITEIETGPQPGSSIIILHGLGADGSDFEPFCQELDLRAIGPVRYVLPSAPHMPVSINGGYEMRAWYDILPSNDERREDEASLRQSHHAIDALINREIARGIPASRIVLMGFSQGCAMALMAGLRQPQRLAGLIALSGYLPLLGVTEAEAHPANRDTPIFMAHGQLDDVVLMSRGARARDHLRSLNYPVSWHTYPMDHSLCMDEVRDINAWLLKVLG